MSTLGPRYRKSASPNSSVVSSTESRLSSRNVTTPLFGCPPGERESVEKSNSSPRHRSSYLTASQLASISKLALWEPLVVKKRRPNFDSRSTRTPFALGRRKTLVRHPCSPLSRLCAPEKEAQEIDRMLRDLTTVFRYNRRGAASDTFISTTQSQDSLFQLHCTRFYDCKRVQSNSHSTIGNWITGTVL